MTTMKVCALLGSFLFLLFACNSATENLTDATATTSPTSLSVPQDTAAPATTQPISQEEPLITSEPATFSLSEPGPYFAGNQVFTFVDQDRAGRAIEILIWYPAIQQTDADGRAIVRNAVPDLSGAPYPLVLTGGNSGSYLFKSHLATYGFVMVIVRSPGFSYVAPWNNAVIDAPLDFLFILDTLTSDPPEGLEDVLDTDRVGVAGYSSDGFFSLALSGARINPAYYFSQCAQAPSLDPPLQPFLIEYYCKLSERWDEFSSQVGAEITTVSGGLWQPTTDDRILAVMPMAPDSAWLYGAEGLASIKIPSLIIAGTADDLVSYKMTSCYVFEHLVNADRFLISFIGKRHMMVENEEIISRINHFAVAFLGYYIQGQTDYAKFFSEDFVTQFDDLAWGVYEGE
jgi:predicted dienelactone hydrolase